MDQTPSRFQLHQIEGREAVSHQREIGWVFGSIDRPAASVEGHLDCQPEMVKRVESPVEGDGQITVNPAALDQRSRERDRCPRSSGLCERKRSSARKGQ